MSIIASLEVRSAIRRREAMGDLSPADAQVATDLLLSETNNVEAIRLEAATLKLAGQVIDRHRLRALDAVQLASALSAGDPGSVSFVCCDERLLAAAASEGLIIVDPARQSSL